MEMWPATPLILSNSFLRAVRRLLTEPPRVCRSARKNFVKMGKNRRRFCIRRIGDLAKHIYQTMQGGSRAERGWRGERQERQAPIEAQKKIRAVPRRAVETRPELRPPRAEFATGCSKRKPFPLPPGEHRAYPERILPSRCASRAGRQWLKSREKAKPANTPAPASTAENRVYQGLACGSSAATASRPGPQAGATSGSAAVPSSISFAETWTGSQCDWGTRGQARVRP